jgi:hypothetical protein
MRRNDFFLGMLLFGILIICLVGMGYCIKQMFLDVPQWHKLIACIGSHSLLMCNTVIIIAIILLIKDMDDD